MIISIEDFEYIKNMVQTFKWEKEHLKTIKENLQFICKQCIKNRFDTHTPLKKSTIEGVPDYQCDCPVQEQLNMMIRLLDGWTE